MSMVSHGSHHETKRDGEAADLRLEIIRLQATLRDVQRQRDRTLRQHRRRMMSIGIAISIVLHLALLAYFATLSRGAGGGGGAQPAGYEFAILHDHSLSDLEDFSFDDDLMDDAAIEAPATDDASAALEATTAAAQLEALGAGADAVLGGAGDGFGSGLDAAGAAAGTSYFGVAGEGTHFVYIVDRSGSMSVYNRMEIATRELVNSIRALPDYAYFKIIFFSSDIMLPPMQEGYLRASRRNVETMVSWLESVTPRGGTIPRPAFIRAFELRTKPDVIFFMTDGIIANFTAEEVRNMNRGGRQTVIHTIAFGMEGSEELLRAIARDSGGQYHFVPDGGP